MVAFFSRSSVTPPLVLFAIFLFITGCDVLDELDDDSPSSVAEEIARTFQETMHVPSTSTVTFIGPVEPGTVIHDLMPGDASHVQATVPDSAGTTYVFFIDDEPTMKLAHDFRYVWMDFDGKIYQVVNAVWDGMIERPGVTSSPFALKESFKIGEVHFTYMDGEGAPEIQDVSNVIPFVSPLDEPYLRRAGKQDPLRREPIKRAFVIDCGGMGGKPDAKNMHDIDAEPIFEWVVDNGFATKKVSQWSKSEDESFKNTPDGEHIRNQFLYAIRDFGILFTSLGKPDNGCDEFFLYVGAHSDNLGNIAIYYPDGSDAAPVGYSDILYWIKEDFPTLGFPTTATLMRLSSSSSALASGNSATMASRRFPEAFPEMALRGWGSPIPRAQKSR